jgi:hypothetical protein
MDATGRIDRCDACGAGYAADAWCAGCGPTVPKTRVRARRIDRARRLPVIRAQLQAERGRMP